MSNGETSWHWSAWHHPNAGGQRQSTTVTAGETLHQSVELHHFFVGYPLVMTYTAMDNHDFLWKIHSKWLFSIAMLVNYQRVNSVEATLNSQTHVLPNPFTSRPSWPGLKV